MKIVKDKDMGKNPPPSILGREECAQVIECKSLTMLSVKDNRGDVRYSVSALTLAMKFSGEFLISDFIPLSVAAGGPQGQRCCNP